MRTLLLFRGAPGCGKSTFIDKHGLKKYALSADDIRLLCASPRMTADGEWEISNSNDKVVWDMLFKLLEIRMNSGEFTVIDATNSKTVEMNRYSELAKMYRYRVFIIDMTDVPIDECKRRNRSRSAEKIVPEEVIDKMYARFATQAIPGKIKVLSVDPEAENYWRKELFLSVFNMSEYKKIHIIGDIHGCNTALQSYINGHLNDDEYYIFCGDYIDRGIENAQVISFLISIMDKKNVCLLEGNHERHLYNWAHNARAKSKEFEENTKIQLYRAGIDKAQVRKLYNRFRQCTLIEYDGKKYFICHGGISNYPTTFMATYQLLHGVGGYDTVRNMCEAWEKNVGEPYNIYQIFGHRSELGADMHMMPHTFALEGRVEFGGYLGILELEYGKEPKCIKIQNTVFRKEAEPVLNESEKQEITQQMSVSDMICAMRSSHYVQEKNFDNDISSFNFTRDAFYGGHWNEVSTKARGLFIDTVENRIVARSYDKFFQIGERMETRMESLHLNLQYPVQVYKKENGYLGIVSYNHKTDELIIASKSSLDGPYAKKLCEMVLNLPGYEDLFFYLQNHDVSFVFEVVDPEFDPHIIEYKRPHLFLLDIIYNDTEFKKVPFDELCNIADELKLEHKSFVTALNNWNEFMSFYNEISAEDYKYNGNYIEGFVFEDANKFMFKFKTPYYKEWKFLRGVMQSVQKRGYIAKTSCLVTPTENYFYGWLREKYNFDKESFKWDCENGIVFMRSEFYKAMKERGIEIE